MSNHYRAEPDYYAVDEQQKIPPLPTNIELGTYNSFNNMNQVDKDEREKLIRADMFLSSDPFSFLKQYFKSKDSFYL